jgi:hypothetical protein
VAWKVIDKTNDGVFMFSEVKPMERLYKVYVVIPLYTAPPKREPLSFEDLNIMWCGNPIDFARRIESIHGIGVDDENICL